MSARHQQQLIASGGGAGISFINNGVIPQLMLTTTISVPMPPGLQVNDIVFVMLAIGGGYSTPNVPASWNFMGYGGSGSIGAQLYYRRYPVGGFADPVSFPNPSGAQMMGMSFAYRGCIATGQPWEAGASDAGTFSFATLFGPLVTPLGPRRRIVNVFDAVNGSFPVGAAFIADPSFTQRYTLTSTDTFNHISAKWLLADTDNYSGQQGISYPPTGTVATVFSFALIPSF